LSSYVKQNSEFQISESEFRFDDFSTVEFKKNIRPEYPKIKNRIVIPLLMGVPEIGTKIRIPNQAGQGAGHGGGRRKAQYFS
jgi:hypothetical protein